MTFNKGMVYYFGIDGQNRRSQDKSDRDVVENVCYIHSHQKMTNIPQRLQTGAPVCL